MVNIKRKIIALLILGAFFLPGIIKRAHHHHEDDFHCDAKTENHFHDQHEHCSFCALSLSVFTSSPTPELQYRKTTFAEIPSFYRENFVPGFHRSDLICRPPPAVL
ncbi:hypothetical protein [Marinilabilia rubra]|uniref:hypothetical protein n=1 Tax=Marinilabilia rubra TaxID=2162893 RepID=UPI0011B298F5|nr:hypothetical protein [Marinilabilia rubra]